MSSMRWKFTHCLERLRFAATMVTMWLAASPLWAQEEAVEGPPSKNYGISYALTGLCLVLGVMIICRPFFARRDKIERPKAEE